MIRLRDKVVYATGNLSNGIILQALTTYLVFFGTSVLGLSGTLIGLFVSISVVWDAISDPFIGHISDYTVNRRFGKRHLFMLIGFIGLTVSNALLWSIDVSWSYMAKGAAIFVFIILVKTFMTLFVTPYNALGGELSEDYYERNNIQAYRTVFFLIGLAFTTVAGMMLFFQPTEAYPIGQLNPISYRALGISISVLILLCSGLATFGTFKFIDKLPVANPAKKASRLGPMIQEFKSIFKNKNYLYVAGAYLSANIATAIVGVIGMHVFTYTFGLSTVQIGIVFGVTFFMSILSQYFWIGYTKRYDKRKAAILAARISLVGGSIFFLLVLLRGMISQDMLWLILYAIPTGFGLGGLITLPFSMIADTVDEEELETGHRSEGLYYGGLTFSYKISQSVAIFLVGVILDVIGFDPNLTVQTQFTEIGLGLVVGIGAILSLVSAIQFYKRYGLTKARIDEIKEQLLKKKIA